MEIPIGSIVTLFGSDARTGERISARGKIAVVTTHAITVEVTSGPDDGRFITLPRAIYHDPGEDDHAGEAWKTGGPQP